MALQGNVKTYQYMGPYMNTWTAQGDVAVEAVACMEGVPAGRKLLMHYEVGLQTQGLTFCMVVSHLHTLSCRFLHREF